MHGTQQGAPRLIVEAHDDACRLLRDTATVVVVLAPEKEIKLSVLYRRRHHPPKKKRKKKKKKKKKKRKKEEEKEKRRII